MKTITSAIFTIILFLFLPVQTSAQNGKEYTGALLWKISGNDLNKPSYVLGTHHLVHVRFADSIPGLKNAMEETLQTVGEVVMSDQAAMQAKIQQAAMMPAGESYSQLLSPNDYKALDEGLKSVIGAGLDQLSVFKPGMISVIYAIKLYTTLYPEFNPMSHEAIDIYVQRIAGEKGKGLLGLETVEDQANALFDAEPLKTQAEGLVCTVTTREATEKQLGILNSYYKAGNILGMYNLAFNNPEDACKMSQAQQLALGTNRNNKWMEKLPGIMKEKPSLIAVGALHLAGEDGILNQLAKKGYKVEPVK